MDYKDPFFVDRGIDPDVAAVRGYHMWDGDNRQDIMAEMFSPFGDKILGWANFVARQEPEDDDITFWGVAFPRFAPPGYDAIPGGLRPSEPVKLSGPKRHYHGADPEVLTDLLPVHVDLAYASPQRDQVKIYFEHSHGGRDVPEHKDHIDQFHGRDIPAGVHGHTFYVIKQSFMHDHIDQTKNPDSHEGFNPQVVHAHQKRAKYLYPPSMKVDMPWDTEHAHDDVTPAQLRRHLLQSHPASNSEEE